MWMYEQDLYILFIFSNKSKTKIRLWKDFQQLSEATFSKGLKSNKLKKKKKKSKKQNKVLPALRLQPSFFKKKNTQPPLLEKQPSLFLIVVVVENVTKVCAPSDGLLALLPPSGAATTHSFVERLWSHFASSPSLFSARGIVLVVLVSHWTLASSCPARRAREKQERKLLPGVVPTPLGVSIRANTRTRGLLHQYLIRISLSHSHSPFKFKFHSMILLRECEKWVPNILRFTKVLKSQGQN